MFVISSKDREWRLFGTTTHGSFAREGIGRSLVAIGHDSAGTLITKEPVVVSTEVEIKATVFTHCEFSGGAISANGVLVPFVSEDFVPLTDKLLWLKIGHIFNFWAGPIAGFGIG